MNGVTILFVYAVIMILATVILTKKEKNVERFCVGSRSENWLMSALSIAATWIWAPALFVSTEKAYSTGWVGLFWFLVPNHQKRTERLSGCPVLGQRDVRQKFQKKERGGRGTGAERLSTGADTSF